MFTRIKLAGILSILLLVAACSENPNEEQTPIPLGEWRHHGADHASTKYAPLSQIDGSNFDQLELAWSYRHGDLKRFPDRASYAGFHATPILLPEEAGGSLVACTPFHKMFAATCFR